MTAWEDVTPWDTARGWAHSDVAVLTDGSIISGHPLGHALVTLHPDHSVSSVPIAAREAHSLWPETTDGEQRIWVADCDLSMSADDGRITLIGDRAGAISLIDVSGATLCVLPTPRHIAYAGGGYLPTAVRPDPASNALWVADGYGAGLIHLIARDGELLKTLGDTYDGVKLDCPHAIFVDQRKTEPELYITDRGNNRLLVLDLEGQLKRCLTDLDLCMPSGLVTVGELLAVTEIKGRITLLDDHDRVVGRLGDNIATGERASWPNALEGSLLVRPQCLVADRLNSPHGIAAHPDGSLLVSEWLIGGRLLRLDLNGSAHA